MARLAVFLTLVSMLLLGPAVAAAAPPPGVPALDPSHADPYVGPIRGVFGTVHFYSPSLGRPMPYGVYLPPGYGRDARRYPVLYMLHGGGGDYAEWPAYGLIDAADELIAAGLIRPLIIVLPQGDADYWLNHVDGPRWGDYLVEDLVPHVDQLFATRADSRYRAVGGVSMGAHAAVQLPANFPGVFGVAGVHSPSLRTQDEVEGLLVWVLGFGQDFAQRDPLSLAATAPGLDGLRIWIDVGNADPWRSRVEQLHATLAERDIVHDWLVGEGDHDGDYWSANVGRYLRFYDGALYAEEATPTVDDEPEWEEWWPY